MKKNILQFVGFWLVLLYSLMAQCQVHDNPDSVSMVGLWKDATIKNINYQLSLNPVNQKDSFFAKVLLGAKEFIMVQSRDNGLRESFFNQVLKQSDVFLQSGHTYIVEHYRSGEGFSAVINIYSLASKNSQYTYELIFGQWKLKETKEVKGNAIESIFANISEYLCDDYYTDESIIMTCLNGNKLVSKALCFPCSVDFKKINSIAFLK